MNSIVTLCKSTVLAMVMLTAAGIAHARDGIDEITMQVMEDIVKEDKGRAIRYLELPRPATKKVPEAQGRGAERSVTPSGNKEQKKEQHKERRGERAGDDAEPKGREDKERRDDGRESRVDERQDNYNIERNERSDDRASVVEDRTDERDSDNRDAATDTDKQESIDHH